LNQNKKRICIIVSIILALALLFVLLFPTICKYNSYRIVKKSGKFYLRFDDVYYYHELYESSDPLILYYLKYKSHNIQHQTDKFPLLPYTLSFSSVEEMKNDILTANFNKTQLHQLAKYVSQNYPNTKLIRVFNPEQLYEPTFPSDFSGYCVEWPSKTNSYICKISSTRSNHEQATWNMISQVGCSDEVDKLLDYESCQPYPYSGGFTDIVHVSDRNATEYYLSTNLKDVIYQFEDQGTTYTVLEKYRGSEQPDTIILYSENPEKCFKVYIHGLVERPSIEWLSQFGIKKYEG